MKFRNLFLIVFLILLISSPMALASEEDFVYETGMDSYYDDNYAETYDYDTYLTSPEGTYMNPNYDLTGFDFTGFDDWDNLNLANPSLDLTSIDNDQFKNVIAREDWQDYGSDDEDDYDIKDDFNTRVSENPSFVNSDKDMMKAWLSGFNTGEEDSIGLICSPTCAIRSYDKESGRVETINYKSYELNGEDGSLKGIAYEVSFNINDPRFDGALINEDGHVIILNGPTVTGGDISFLEDDNEGESSTVIVDCSETFGGVELDGNEYYKMKVIDGHISTSSLSISSFPEGDQHTEFVIEGDTINIVEGSELSVFSFKAVDYEGMFDTVDIRGSLDRITVDDNDVFLESDGLYNLFYTEEINEEYIEIVAYTFEGNVNFDRNDIDFDSDNVIQEINLGENTQLRDFANGFIVSVNEPSSVIYEEGGCFENTNCLELYQDEEVGGFMSVAVDEGNQIDVQLVNIETDGDWLGRFEVNPISNDCDECKVTLNDNNKVRLEFSNKEPVAQGDLSMLTVGTINTYYDAEETNTIAGEEITEIAQHRHEITAQHSIVCSNCKVAGIVRSEYIDLSDEERFMYAYTYTVRVANDPVYGSVLGGTGSTVIYAWENANALFEGERMSAAEYNQKYSDRKEVEYSYGCINLVQAANEYASGGTKNWDRFWSSTMIAEELRESGDNIQTEYVTRYSIALPESVTNDKEIIVVRFDTDEEISDYLSGKTPGSSLGYYSYDEGGDVVERHTAIKGVGADTIEAHIHSNDITIDEGRLAVGSAISTYDGILVTSIREQEEIITEEVLLADSLPVTEEISVSSEGQQ